MKGTSLFYIALLLLFCQFCIAQSPENKRLYGQVTTDSLRIDNGYVLNMNSRIRTTIKSEGYFEIPAKENDTLVFLGLSFESKKIVLSRLDFKVLLKVKLKAAINDLDEVVVKSNAVKPNVGNSQDIVDKKYFDDQWSSAKNAIYSPSGTFTNQADLIRMFQDVKRLFKKKSKEPVYEYAFPELVLNNVDYGFFTNALKLKQEDIALFLIYCQNDPKSNEFLASYNDFEVKDFLITKNDEFKKMVIFEQ